MKAAGWLCCVLASAWMVVGGTVALITGTAVIEVLVVMLGALALAALAAVLLVDDLAGPRR